MKRELFSVRQKPVYSTFIGSSCVGSMRDRRKRTRICLRTPYTSCPIKSVVKTFRTVQRQFIQTLGFFAFSYHFCFIKNRILPPLLKISSLQCKFYRRHHHSVIFLAQIVNYYRYIGIYVIIQVFLFEFYFYMPEFFKLNSLLLTCK